MSNWLTRKRFILVCVCIVTGLGIVGVRVHDKAGNDSVTSEHTDRSDFTAPAKATGCLASAADNSWAIFLDNTSGTVEAVSYSNDGEKADVSAKLGPVYRYSVESIDFSGIDVAGLGSWPCHTIAEYSNLQILVQTNNRLCEPKK